MKNSKSILSLITSQPQFGSLVQHECYQKFMALLPPRFQKAIAFVYIKNKILHLALSHPGYKMELNYNKELIKDLLETLHRYAPECQAYCADEVVIFNSKYHQPKEDMPSNSTPFYSELSSGEFTVDTENSELNKKFEQTKKLIEQNINRSNS